MASAVSFTVSLHQGCRPKKRRALPRKLRDTNKYTVLSIALRSPVITVNNAPEGCRHGTHSEWDGLHTRHLLESTHAHTHTHTNDTNKHTTYNCCTVRSCFATHNCSDTLAPCPPPRLGRHRARVRTRRYLWTVQAARPACTVAVSHHLRADAS